MFKVFFDDDTIKGSAVLEQNIITNEYKLVLSSQLHLNEIYCLVESVEKRLSLKAEILWNN